MYCIEPKNLLKVKRIMQEIFYKENGGLLYIRSDVPALSKNDITA